MRAWVFLLIVLIPFLIGCITKKESAKDSAIALCMSLCNDALINGKNLSNGPCLSDNNQEWNIENWVCDVAHSPRKDIDNLPENQCKEYRFGNATHFVEVNEKCEFIRAI